MVRSEEKFAELLKTSLEDDALVAALKAAIVERVRAVPFGDDYDGNGIDTAIQAAIRQAREEGSIEYAPGPSTGIGRLRVPRAAWIRRLAAYALVFVDGSCGPDVDALAERFGEILSGKTREASGVAAHPFAKPAEDEPSRLDEAIEMARAFVFPALGAGHGLLLRWLTELRDRRELHPARPATTPDSAPTDELAEELSTLVRECFTPNVGPLSQWKAAIRGRAIRIYRHFRPNGRLPPEAVVLLDFVHTEVLKEAVPPRGGQPIPHA